MAESIRFGHSWPFQMTPNLSPLKPAIFVLDRFTPTDPFIIRLVVPGIDGGHAVYLETEFKRETLAEVESIAEQIADALPRTVFLKDTPIE